MTKGYVYFCSFTSLFLLSVQIGVQGILVWCVVLLILSEMVGFFISFPEDSVTMHKFANQPTAATVT